MNKKIRNINFSKSEQTNSFIIESLEDYGVIYLDDLEEIEHWELLKIYGLGVKKIALIQEIMIEHSVQFKNKQFLESKYLPATNRLVIK